MANVNKVLLYEGDFWDEKTITSQLTEIIPSEQYLNDLKKIHDYMLQYGFYRMVKGEGKGLRFVGKFEKNVAGKEIQFLCLPKYMKNPNSQDGKIPDLEDLPLVVKAIEKTNHLYDYIEDIDFDEKQYRFDKKYIKRYQLAKWIVNDYSINGIFFIKERKHTNLHKGKVNWAKTVAKKIPYIDGEDIYYHAPIYSYTYKNDAILLSEIHRCVVKEALSFIAGFGEGNTVIQPECDESMLGKLEQFVGVIKNAQRLVFSDRDISLLRALESWCEKQSRYYKLPVGTVSFELVWEDCVREVFGNISKDFSFGSPEYKLGEKNLQVNGDSIPDVINIFQNDEKGVCFLLLDAKYYRGEITKKSTMNNKKLKEKYQWITGFPGYKDIAKQFDYYNTIVNKYGIKNGLNAFVMPWYDIPGLEDRFQQEESKKENALNQESDQTHKKWRYLGYAYKGEIEKETDEIWQKLKELNVENPVVEQQSKSSEEKVQVVQIDPKWLYEQMINQKEDKDDIVKEFWKYSLQFQP